MGTAAGGKAYFQRGSLFWFTVITLSFGYYTIFQDGGDEVRGGQGCFRLLPSGQTFALAGHGPGAGLFRVGCLLASQYPLSEPRAPGPLHSVLGGPPSQPPAQWVLACLADSCGRVLVRHGFVQV